MLVSSSLTPDLARQIIKAKALAQRNRTARNRTYLVGVTLGISVAAALYFLGFGEDLPQRFFEYGVFCGASAAGVYIYVINRWKTKSAICPVCAYCWEIREGSGVRPEDIMTNWSHCPGCRISIDDHTLRKFRG